ncbi:MULTISPECIES: DUF1003 domain-containing protein [Alicyclobacillus]|nr:MULTISPECIES: DUF1003 domain-containing protein [Alicyclobacillus]EPZ48282.1 hypothetical protein N007_00755 [Alicyclobacillus acidoterrestris ATCC 49025]
MAMNKEKVFYARHDAHDDETMIEGFDIPMNRDDVERIDRLVDDYEKSIISRIDDEYLIKTTFSDRLADGIARFGGSWTFIIYFGAFLVAWMIWNTLPFTKSLHFDEPPFILLNLCLSFLAAFQAPVIMMSQNRQAARDKHESVINFAINYKAEKEVDDIQKHLHRIEGNNVQNLENIRNEFREIRALLSSIEAKLDEHHTRSS